MHHTKKDNHLAFYPQKNVFTLFLFFMVLLPTISNGQPDSFTRNNNDVFLQELNYITDNLDRGERNKAQLVLDSFAARWNSELLTDPQRKWIYNTLDTIQNLRLRPWPEQALYLKNLLVLWDTQHMEENFEVWHKSFQSLLDLRNQRRLLRYWETTHALFEKNIITQSNVVRWELRSNDYVLNLEDETPMVRFSGTDLVCFSQDDSTLIMNTIGKVDLFENVLHGNSGKITWQRAQLHPDSVFANLKNYTINLAVARWEADSVTFYNLRYFDEALIGKLTERIIAETNHENARYPRFESYQAVHEIRNLFPGIDYIGGFAMQGPRVIGSGTSKSEASINISRNDSLFITARGSNFSILNDRIITQRAAVSIYLSGDSIYHPNIQMRYLNPTREFSLLRDDKGFSRAPFNNSFHQINMYVEALYWNIDAYEIELRMIRSISETGEAVFESHDFFSHMKYMRMQGMANLHPLITLRNFGRESDTNTFHVSDYARFIRGDIASVSSQMLNFAQDGFITYNQEEETVTLGDKLFHYITSYAGRSDFDVIQLTSTTTTNAKLNMNNFDLHVFGVERIPLSDQKNVVLHPNDEQIVMKKNRDIYFDGRIESGLFDFYGTEFFFDYNLFKIELLQTDSMSFRVRSFEPDARGDYSLVRVQTVLEGINGELLVDHPRNKSGQMPFPRFPIFNSNNESFVYYDRDDVQDGVYSRDNVFFKLIPFSIDSLDNATTDNIAFDGVFVSTGIFPDFYDYLTVQTDYSLGFNTKTPEDGYTIYGGKAVYKGPIDMSYEGLRADGELQYLNANIQANQMLMFPDSARASVDTFMLAAQASPVEYPDVSGQDVNMLYLPHQDDMNISTITEPLEIYNAMATLEGSISVTPEGLTGDGKLSFFGGVMLAEDFSFKLDDFDSERTHLSILAQDGESTSIEARDYKSFVNMKDQTAELRTIEGESMLDFSSNRFNGFGYDLDWDMQNGMITMENQLRSELTQLGQLQYEEWIHYDFSGHELVSTHPAQDGLSFYAGKVEYDLSKNIIQASEVNIIKVADAAVFPDEGTVQILERAEFSQLQNAYLVANTQNMLYHFYQADINITSRWSYSGSGIYDYTDVAGNVQPIFFESIGVDRAFRSTIASAQIEKSNDFTLSPHFGFFGSVDLKAENPNLFYKGNTTIFADCPLFNPNWIRFESEIKKDSIFIPLEEELRNDANGRIHTALMLAGDSVHIYPAIFDRQRHYSDIPIVSASGYLTFNTEMRQYQISTGERLTKANLPDDIIFINPNTCMIEGFGDVTLSEGMGQFQMTNYGSVTHNLRENEVELDIVMGIDFFFLNPALAMIEENIRESEHTEPLNVNRQKYVSFLHKSTTEATAQRLIEEFVADGEFRRFPAELNHTFFFADLRMKWDQTSQTFYTTNKPGIGNMEVYPLNLYMDGFVEIRKQRGNDVFNMILVPSGLATEGIGTNWFFITYSGGIMQTIAANNEFNNMIRNVNPRRRRMDVERGEEPFSYMLSSDRRPIDFVRSMRLLNREL